MKNPYKYAYLYKKFTIFPNILCKFIWFVKDIGFLSL